MKVMVKWSPIRMTLMVAKRTTYQATGDGPMEYKLCEGDPVSAPRIISGGEPLATRWWSEYIGINLPHIPTGTYLSRVRTYQVYDCFPSDNHNRHEKVYHAVFQKQESVYIHTRNVVLDIVSKVSESRAFDMSHTKYKVYRNIGCVLPSIPRHSPPLCFTQILKERSNLSNIEIVSNTIVFLHIGFGSSSIIIRTIPNANTRYTGTWQYVPYYQRNIEMYEYLRSVKNHPRNVKRDLPNMKLSPTRY